jgi:hypothetical protein
MSGYNNKTTRIRKKTFRMIKNTNQIKNSRNQNNQEY